jgi:hypothetical protein
VPNVLGIDLGLPIRVLGGDPPDKTAEVELTENVPGAETTILTFTVPTHKIVRFVSGAPLWVKLFDADGAELPPSAMLNLYFTGSAGSGMAFLIGQWPYLPFRNLTWAQQVDPKNKAFAEIDMKPPQGRALFEIAERYEKHDGNYVFTMYGADRVEIRLLHNKKVAWTNANTKLITWVNYEPEVITPRL